MASAEPKPTPYLAPSTRTPQYRFPFMVIPRLVEGRSSVRVASLLLEETYREEHGRRGGEGDRGLSRLRNPSRYIMQSMGARSALSYPGARDMKLSGKVAVIT